MHINLKNSKQKFFGEVFLIVILHWMYQINQKVS